MSDIVSFTEHDNYSLIQLDDGKANAISFALLEQINAALDTAESSGKVLLLAGRPGKFSAGFDLSVMSQGGENVMKLLAGGAQLAKRLLQYPTPVVMAVSGHALAMGGLLLFCGDYRVGTKGSFKIGLNEVAIGMTMPHFGVELARGRLTPAHFNLSLNNAYLYDADTAIPAGYLDAAVEPDDLMGHAQAVAEQLSTVNMVAHRETKARVRAPLLAALDVALEMDFAG